MSLKRSMFSRGVAMGSRRVDWRGGITVVLLSTVACLLLLDSFARAASSPTSNDDRTFRPTVVVRQGNAQGSGTIIASVAGETLVLTAAHVVRGRDALSVEIHRYNLGVETALPVKGWPLSIPAEVAAVDALADIAVLRVRGRLELPFVARLAAAGDEPPRGALLTSVGIDGGDRFKSWTSPLSSVIWFAMDEAGPGELLGRAGPGVESERPFLLTGRAPEHGRSGGGLFAEGGSLVGVCVGRIELTKNRPLGVFASSESVRRLLREHDLDVVVDRSEARRISAPIRVTRSRPARETAATRP